jgi:tryptophan 2,3-dioxygenase
MSNDKGPTQVDITGEDVRWDFREAMSYGGYLHLDKVLSSQQPRSSQHDEMLFITIHQVSELWIKLVLHEVGAALACVQEDRVGPAFKMLSRVKHIQTQLNLTWDVLSTLTPADYASFRDSLGSSSGFQSYQYRLLEFALGNKNAKMIEVHRHDPELFAKMKAALETPSFYDECLMLLARRGFAIPAGHIERNWGEPYEPSPEVEAAWLEIYRDTEKHWELYELAEKLVDIEDSFQQWRFRHMKTVERIIGHKRGTGGTSGVSYLKKALELRFFPELWNVRTSV